MKDARSLEGILVVDKPVGPTSHDVVALVRRLSGVRRVGHGGTLDPFARGVLPIFIGRATKVVEYHAADAKEYRATVVFGARSSTDDLEGELTQGEEPAPERQAVEDALVAFRGPIRQRPPAFSAVKIAGRRAHRAARAGEALRLPERAVTIERLDLVGWDASDPARPAAELEIVCSAGTYVRAIARDLGGRLGGGAYLAALSRIASGPFRLTDAHSLDVVRGHAAASDLGALLLPLDHGLEGFPQVAVSAEEAQAIAQGQVIRPSGGFPPRAPGEGERARVVADDGRLLAIARVIGGRLHPDKVLVERG